ncbi:MAG TPA: hypothetical protein GX709_03265 [Clostridiales bacterium]|nr:hypothetical protein [Clostridiales bacterium]
MYKLKCSVCGNDLSIYIYQPSKVLYECPYCKNTSMIRCGSDGIVMTLKNVPQVKLGKTDDLVNIKTKPIKKDSSTKEMMKPIG